jgi:hypothetical protein
MGKKNIDKICFGKNRYETEEEAWNVSDYIWETEKVDLDIYKCPICNGWHLTSKRKRRY